MRLLPFCLIIYVLFISCTSKPEQLSPTSEKITESVYASGVIKARNQYQVFATISGILDTVLVNENDPVMAGSQLLIVTDENSKFNSTGAQLSAEYANLNENRDKLTDLMNNILLAETKCTQDSLDFIRQENLWKENIGSKIDLELRALTYKNSRTALEASKIRYADLKRQLQFNAAQSRNTLAQSRNREGDFIIKSKITGKVYSLLKEKGEIINPQTVLAIIGDADNFFLELQVDEYDIVKMKVGQKILITMDSYKGDVFEATVSKINPLMNERSKSFTIEATFIKQPPALFPNLTAEANIVIQTKENALTIPRNYLINDSLVLISETKTKPVITGLRDYQKVEILSGLSAGDIIYKPQ